MENYIFLDFDETLGHTWIERSWEDAVKRVVIEQTNEYQEVDCFKLPDDDYVYVTFLRPGIRDFLTWCADKVRGRVYVLTSATSDYITEINRMFNLGFSKDKLISREDIYPINPEMVQNKFSEQGNFVLVDNLIYNDHREGFNSKVSFLHNLPKPNYIQVDEYYPGGYEDVEFWADLKKRIGKILID